MPNIRVGDGRLFAEHFVDTCVQVVNPPGKRVAVLKHLLIVLRRLQIGDEIVAAFPAREDIAQAVEEHLVLDPLLCGRVAWVVERNRVQCHPQTGSPYVCEKSIVAVEIV